jgi:hypothetical protein
MEEIEALCDLVNDREMLAQAIREKLSLSAVRKALQAKKAAAQVATPVPSGNPSLASAAEQSLNQQASQLATSKGVSFAQAYTQVLTSNPALYQQYLAEKDATNKAGRQ